MPKTIRAAFENRIISLAIAEIGYSKQIEKQTLSSNKFKAITASVKEIGIIEPPIVCMRDGKFFLLDGHLRLEALKKLKIDRVNCLVSKDDEDFTYNKHVNRVASIQEHKMITKALERGVSAKKLAKVLNVAEEYLHDKRNLLDGICPEVVEMLKNRVQCGSIFPYLKKLKPYRQIEAVNLMNESHNFTIKFARAIYLASSDGQLVDPEKRRRHVDMDRLGNLENEVVKLQSDYKLIEDGYGINVLNLTLVRGYLKNIFYNKRVNKYLQTYASDLYGQFDDIVDAESLETGQ